MGRQWLAFILLIKFVDLLPQLPPKPQIMRNRFCPPAWSPFTTPLLSWLLTSSAQRRLINTTAAQKSRQRFFLLRPGFYLCGPWEGLRKYHLTSVCVCVCVLDKFSTRTLFVVDSAFYMFRGICGINEHQSTIPNKLKGCPRLLVLFWLPLTPRIGIPPFQTGFPHVEPT